MENASKALIMAAGVLIGIMVLSLGAYLFISFSNSASETQEQIRQSQIAQFNNPFTKLDGRNDVTIYDILTVANLAKNNNTYNGVTYAERTNGDYINVIKLPANGWTGAAQVENFANQYLNDSTRMSSEMVGDSLQTYTCIVHINENTEKVDQVKFTKN